MKEKVQKEKLKLGCGPLVFNTLHALPLPALDLDLAGRLGAMGRLDRGGWGVGQQ